MKQNFFKKLATGTLLLALPLVFNGCGNVDNPLEEIINNASTPPVFKKYNPNTDKWETIDLSKVDFTKLDEAYVKKLLKEGELHMTAGRYLVEGNVTINADVFPSGGGALQILLSDGSKLQINGAVCCSDEVSLEIYGQTANTGVMSVNSTGGNSAVRADGLVVGGANLITEAKGTYTAAIEVIGSFEQHAGAVKATTDNASVAALINGDANIYGGKTKFDSAEGNAVCIEGNAKIGGDVYGGYAENGKAEANTVSVSAQGATGGIAFDGGNGKLIVKGGATVNVTATGAGTKAVDGSVIADYRGGSPTIQLVGGENGLACTTFTYNEGTNPGTNPNFYKFDEDGHWIIFNENLDPGDVWNCNERAFKAECF